MWFWIGMALVFLCIVIFALLAVFFDRTLPPDDHDDHSRTI